MSGDIRRRQASAGGWVRLFVLCLAILPAAAAEIPQAVREKCLEINRLRREAKYDEAILFGRSALADAEREYGRDSVAAATVMIHLVSALADGGKAGDGEALPLAQRALEIQRGAGDPPALADSLLSLGTLQWRLGDYASARGALQESIDVSTAAFGPDDLRVASAVENLGILLWTTGEYGEARALLERTLQIRQARLDAGDDLIGRTLNNLAILHSQMGNYALARQMYERSLEIRKQTLGLDHPQTADVIDNLALVLQDQGEDREARELFEEALEIRERTLGPDHPFVALSLVNVGGMLQDAGELDRALEMLQRAVALFEKAYGGKHRRVATALEGVARVQLAMGRHDDARRNAERALAIREEIAPGDVRVADALGLLSRANEEAGDLPAALRLRERAVEVSEASLGGEHPIVAWNLVGLALLQIEVGKLDLAAENLERALSIRESQLGPAHPDVALALGPLASLRWRQGNVNGARAAARRAGEIQDAALRDTLQALPEQHALHLASRSVEPEVVLFSGLLQAGDQAADWLAPCWDWTLRRRGLVFDELARRQQAALVSGSPETLATWEHLSEARRRLAALWIRGPGDGDPQKYRDLLSGATEAKKAAETELARTTVELGSEAPADRGDVQRALPPDAVLVELIQVAVSPLRSTERTLQDVALILFGGGRMEFVNLGPSERIDTLVRDWRMALEADIDLIAGGDSTPAALDGSRRTGAALRRAVWDPIAAKIGVASVVFLVPDGALHRVDLRALPLDDGRYLVESGPRIHLLSTGRDLVRFARKDDRSRPTSRGMLALGDPDFGADPGARVEISRAFRGLPDGCQGLAGRAWPPLPQSGLEVKEIAELAPADMPVEVATGKAASEERLRRDAAGRRILHLATHGFFLPQECAAGVPTDPQKDAPSESLRAGIGGGNPLLLSGLVLAGAGASAEEGDDDGILTAEEIAGLDLTGVRLAVLSACDTGQGRIAVGEGVFGLRRALEISGVRTVVMSLWRVPDRDARRWMKGFYTALFGGTPPGEAARRASLDALARLREREQPAHPYLWAGFVTVGDWR